MPRPKKPGGPEPKRRSRTGCWPCKTRKIKCGEEKPKCQNCQRQSETCDYSIRLNWEGRTKRKSNDFTPTPEPVFKATTPKSGSQTGIISPTPSDNSTHGSVFEIATIKTESGKFQNALKSPRDIQKPIHDKIGEPFAQEWEFASESPQTPVGQDQASNVSFLAAGVTKNGGSTLPRNVKADVLQADIPSRTSVPDLSSKVFPSAPRRGFRDSISASQLSRIRDQNTSPYPSPTDSSMDSPSLPSSIQYGHKGHSQPTSNPQMPPPSQSPVSFSLYSGVSRKSQEDGPVAGEHRSKRLRINPTLEMSDNFHRTPPISYSNYNGGPSKAANTYNSPQFSSYRPYSPSNNHGGIVLTPVSLSGGSEDSNTRSTTTTSSVHFSQGSPDLRRLSVSSLLSPSGGEEPQADSGHGSVAASATPTSPAIGSQCSTQTINFGLDRGFPDLDWPNNNDENALNGLTPSLSTVGLCYSEADVPPEFGFGLHAVHESQAQEGYYARPVTVAIPTSLGTLPAELVDNPMNMLYFHHFLNHTARILVPHDCSENPFKSILPQMAVSDSNLLHLLLAYSASHRARLLKHPEPGNRIAHWVENVFPSLRRALNDTSQITNASLATAIMLASLEIISPNTFDVPVSWQNHLNVARRMILARGGAGSVHRQDRVSYFLSRWFAYLDVLGSLSGSKNDQPLFSGDYWASDDADDDEHAFQIDCLMGFTSRCVSILARIAELARLCDSERIDSSGNLRDGWYPSPPTIAAAEKLKHDLQDARTHRYSGCPHRQVDNEIEDGLDSIEMLATNDAFHWAGQIHLNRRVLGRESEHPEVQFAVGEIVFALSRVRKGGTAEACLLFPMFTAGCDARVPAQRKQIMERVRNVEGSGMTQVNKARRLMEKVWETGRPWETLVQGEFFG